MAVVRGALRPSGVLLFTGVVMVTGRGATDHHWSVIRSDHLFRFGTRMIRGLIYEKKRIVRMFSPHTAVTIPASSRDRANTLWVKVCNSSLFNKQTVLWLVVIYCPQRTTWRTVGMENKSRLDFGDYCNAITAASSATSVSIYSRCHTNLSPRLPHRRNT